MQKNINSLKPFGEGTGKYKAYHTQLKTIFNYLKIHTATASMVTAATGIPQKCVTRYKRDLEEQGLLSEVRKEKCKHTGFQAWYLTTNPNLFPQQNRPPHDQRSKK